jgi:hypothetical protein
MSLHLNPDNVLLDASQAGIQAAPGFFLPGFGESFPALVERFFTDDCLWEDCSRRAREIALRRFFR